MSELLNILDFTAKQAHSLAAEQSVTEEPIVIDGVTIIPVSKVSCGFSFGGSTTAGKKEHTTAGAGAKVSKSPLRMIAIADGRIQVLDVDAEKAKKLGLAEVIKPLISIFKKDKAEKESPKEVQK